MVRRRSRFGRMSFNPPPPFQARERWKSCSVQLSVMFQSTPAFSGEGTRSRVFSSIRLSVSIHPRLFRRGNTRWGLAVCTRHRFNPPPPFQAREPHCQRWCAVGVRFNPPPPFQAREHYKGGWNDIVGEFQSTPAFSGEGTLVDCRPDADLPEFQSTPAFSGEGTIDLHRRIDDPTVSIHPRLFRRGNAKLATDIVHDFCFNPPPPFQAREPDERHRYGHRSLGFNPPPPFQAREPPGTYVQFHAAKGFNPPPPFQARERSITHPARSISSFNPPPPFQAREQTSEYWVSDSNTVSIHPRLFRRGNECL